MFFRNLKEFFSYLSSLKARYHESVTCVLKDIGKLGDREEWCDKLEKERMKFMNGT